MRMKDCLITDNIIFGVTTMLTDSKFDKTKISFA